MSVLISGSYPDDFGELIQFYLDTDKQIIKAELDLWQQYFKTMDNYITSLQRWVGSIWLCKKEMFSNVNFLVQILCTLPMCTSTP